MTQATKLNDLALPIIFPEYEWEAIAALNLDDYEPFVQRIIIQARSRLNEARAVFGGRATP